jgi:hypothetical protein
VTGTNWYRRDTVAFADPPFKDADTLAVLSLVNVPAVMVRLADAAPAGTVSVEGAFTVPTARIATVAPLEPAALFSITVQVEVIPGPMIAGAHCSEVTNTGPSSDKPAFAVPPFNEAVRVAGPSMAIKPAVTPNVTEAEPAGTVTVAGAVNRVVSDEIDTTAPPAGAACDSVSVQAAFAFDGRAVGEHCNVAGVTGASVILVLAVVPFRLAVTVALPLAEPTLTEAAKTAVPEPAGIFAFPGTVTLALLELRPTVMPPEGAAADSETVHVLDPENANDAGVQLTLLSVAGGAGEEVMGATATAFPLASAPRLEPIVTPLAEPGTVIVATMPLGIATVPSP